MKFSICIPVFNMESTIQACIRSALCQSSDSYEVIVLDNCSTDRTYEKALSFTDQPRLRVVRNSQNVGAYGNHNEALRLARGEWVKFLHGDDELLPGCLRAFDAAIPQCPPGTALLSCGAILFDSRGREVFRTPIPSDLFIMRSSRPEEFILEGNIFGTPTMCLIHRQRLLDLGGFDVQTEPNADGDAWILLRSHYPHAILGDHLVIIRNDPPGSLAQRSRGIQAVIQYTVNMALKWRSAAGLTGELKGTVYGDWVCRDCVRFWPVVFKLSCMGRPDALLALWTVLKHVGLQWAALGFWLRLLFQGKGSANFRAEPWTLTLAHLRIPTPNRLVREPSATE